MGGVSLCLDIQDTGSSYKDEFPAMFTCSLASADAVLLVYSVAELDTFDEVSRLRDLVQQQRGDSLPLVVVGNKTDLERNISREEAEATVNLDWENGYVECCAKDNKNIQAIFRTLLVQAKSPILRLLEGDGKAPIGMRRRKSFPQVPRFSRLQSMDSPRRSSFAFSPSMKRRSSAGVGRRESCVQQ